MLRLKLFLYNSSSKAIKVYFEDVDMYDLAAYTDQVQLPASISWLDGVKFYFDDNPNPCTFTENESAKTFSWEGLPSDLVLNLVHLRGVPSYDDGSGNVPPQSGDFPYAVDQFGGCWCILAFVPLSDWP